MKLAAWIFVFAAIGWLLYRLRRWKTREAERERASEQRLAALMAQAMAAAPPKASAQPDPAVAKQKLLLDAAAKAAEAGEPVLSIQLYARLLARFPDSAFAEQARLAVEQQKRNLAKA